MAKKKKKKKVEVREPQVQEQTVVVEQPKPKMETPSKSKKKYSTSLEKNWEFKDRMYYLVDDKRPLSRLIKSNGIYYFDEERGYERELKNTSNQRTCFVDEMVGDQRLEHIIFRSGFLNVPKNKQTLQKLLSLYHPHKGVVFNEFNPVKKAVDEVAGIELEIEALNTAMELDIDLAEAVLRVESGSKVSEMSSKEIKRDLLLYAKRNPRLFLDLVNDENVHLRNIGIKATELGIITLSQDQRTFTWTSNKRKLMNIPFEEHPYSALAAWFKTDEGMEVFSSIEKKLKQ